MLRRLGALIVAGLLAVATQTSAQIPLKTAMHEKLANAQQLMRAVITGDYAAVERYSRSLGRISETEIGSWQARANPDYTRNAEFFLLSVKGLRDAAAKHDRNAANEEYLNLLSSCVHCHAYVRDLRMVSATGRQP